MTTPPPPAARPVVIATRASHQVGTVHDYVALLARTAREQGHAKPAASVWVGGPDGWRPVRVTVEPGGEPAHPHTWTARFTFPDGATVCAAFHGPVR